MDTKEITLYTKVYIVKAMVFSVVMYEYESWTIKKVVKAKSFSCARLSVTPWTIAYEVPPSMEFSRQEYWSGLSFPSEHQRTDAFKLWCWRLRVSWTPRKSNQSILKEINPEYSLEGLMLKLQYFCHIMQLIGKDPDTGKDWVHEQKGATEDVMVGWHHWLNRHECEWTLGDGEGQGSLVCCSPWGCKESDMTEWVTEQRDTDRFTFTNINMSNKHKMNFTTHKNI